jgi:hypothetical protein
MQIVLEFDQSSKLKYNWAEITKNKTDVITLNYFVNKQEVMSECVKK